MNEAVIQQSLIDLKRKELVAKRDRVVELRKMKDNFPLSSVGYDQLIANTLYSIGVLQAWFVQNAIPEQPTSTW